jgi:hypothetical protein
VSNGPFAGGKINAGDESADAGQYGKRPFHGFRPDHFCSSLDMNETGQVRVLT